MPDTSPAADTFRIGRPPGPGGWYWATQEDDVMTLFGPHPDRATAVDAWLATCGADLRADLEREGDWPLPIPDDLMIRQFPDA